MKHTLEGWYIGLGLLFVVVIVVVVLVALILFYAARIGGQVRNGIGSMDQARGNTDPVWAIQGINVAITGIWRAAESARLLLTGGGR